MDAQWQEVVECLLRPKRAGQERVAAAKTRFDALRRERLAERARALAAAVAEIESARAVVFARDDGIVSAEMTALERRWRALSRPDEDGEAMDYWSLLVPARWLDRKLFRGAPRGQALALAGALASDLDGVEAVEAAVADLARTLGAHGGSVGGRARFVFADAGEGRSANTLDAPLASARAELDRTACRGSVEQRARAIEASVRDAARARGGVRAELVEAVARAAAAETLLEAARLVNPIEPLRRLWCAGYLLVHADEAGVVVGVAA